MSEKQRVTRIFSKDEQPITLKLTRGAKGVYRWDLNVKAGTLDRAIEIAKCGDRRLRDLFLQKQKMEIHIPSDSGDVSQDKTHAHIDQSLKNVNEAGKKLAENEGGFK